MMNVQRLVFTLVTIVTMTLAGCGGGGGGGSSPVSSMDPMDGGPETPQPPTTQPDNGGPTTPSVSAFTGLNANSTTADNIVTAIGKVAEATPRAVSVTQSSNVDGNGVTTDQVEVTAEYGANQHRFSVRNGTEWSIGMSEGNPGSIPDAPSPWKGSQLSKRVSGGTVYVNAYSDIDAPTTSQVDSGDDGTRDVPLGAMVTLDGFVGGNILLNFAGGFTGSGRLNGEPGTFNCSGGCEIASGGIIGGDWMFTPRRPPGAEDISGSDALTWTGTFNRDRLPGTRNGEQGYFRCLSSSCGESRSSVNGRVQMRLTGNWVFVPSSGRTVSTPDTDYLAGGVWLFVPTDATSAADYVFGAFGDGNDHFLQENLIALTGTATYRGDAIGVYSEKTTTTTDIGYFNGDVELTANFGGGGDLGTISGSITNFEVDGEADVGTLNLGTANIGSLNSGFFQGDVTGSDDERSFTGNWGGQFFGNGESDGRPGSVAGTFGGQSTDDAVNFVGAFGAHKQ